MLSFHFCHTSKSYSELSIQRTALLRVVIYDNITASPIVDAVIENPHSIQNCHQPDLVNEALICGHQADQVTPHVLLIVCLIYNGTRTLTGMRLNVGVRFVIPSVRRVSYSLLFFIELLFQTSFFSYQRGSALGS